MYESFSEPQSATGNVQHLDEVCHVRMESAAMPIIMKQRRTRCGPVMICSFCGQQITDAATGHVFWDASAEAPVPYFTHRGCAAAFELSHPEADCHQPLSAWLIYLANSARLPWLRAGKLALKLAGVI